MQSVMNSTFSTVPSANVSRSMFDRSGGHKTALDADYIYPFFIEFVVIVAGWSGVMTIDYH